MVKAVVDLHRVEPFQVPGQHFFGPKVRWIKRSQPVLVMPAGRSDVHLAALPLPFMCPASVRMPRASSGSSDKMGSQHLRHAPGLGMHPRGRNGGSASKISLIVPIRASRKWSSNARANCAPRLILVDFQTGVQIVTNQPGPDGTLMVRRIPGPQITGIGRLIVSMPGRQRPKPKGSQEFFGDNIDDLTPSLRPKDGKAQGHRKNLIRPKTRSSPSSPSTTSYR